MGTTLHKKTAVIRLAARIKAERDWIVEHGGSEAGYIAKYGSASDPDHYGDGGEAIYAADCGKLNFLLSEMEFRTGMTFPRKM